MRHTILFVLCLALLVTGVSATEFVVTPGQPGDTVYFRSTASLEFIEGKTTDLTGWLDWDPDNPAGPVSGILRVDLRTLKTGIDTRDEHMRDNHLHTDQYPFAWFELQSLADMPASISPGQGVSAVAEGYFYIHGNRKKLAADISFELDQSGQELSVKVGFAIKLDEWEIERPKALFLKLAETIEVEVIYTARVGAEKPVVELPDWPELK